MDALNACAKAHLAFVPTDNLFQRRARLLQALWREEQGYPIGIHAGRYPLGSRLEMPWAEETLANYLTDTIRAVVRREVYEIGVAQGKLIQRPRIFDDLLSSQPLCFNLFAELQQYLPLATRLFATLTQHRVDRVTAIHFEHSPGRGDQRYTGDASAFDVYVEYLTPRQTCGFLGIEVKYHENLQNPAAVHKDRYDAVADMMGCFHPEKRAELRQAPLQQLWRDHLLAGSLRAVADFAEGIFLVLYPGNNMHCARAVAAYQATLSVPDSFLAITLEDLWRLLAQDADQPWVAMLFRRYLDFTRVDRAVARVSA